MVKNDHHSIENYCRWFGLRYRTPFTEAIYRTFHERNTLDFRYESYIRLLVVFIDSILFTLILMYIDRDDHLWMWSLKQTNFYKIGIGRHFPKILCICYVINLIHGIIVVWCRYWLKFDPQTSSLIQEAVINCEDYSKAIIMKDCDQTTKRHVQQAVILGKFLNKLGPIVHTCGALIAITVTIVLTCMKPPANKLVIFIDFLVLLVNILSIRFLVSAWMYLFLVAMIGLIFVRDRFIHLTKQLKVAYHKQCDYHQYDDVFGERSCLYMNAKLNMSRARRRVRLFMRDHNYLCQWVSKADPYCRKIYSVVLAANIPLHIMMIHLLMFQHQKFDWISYMFLCVFTTIQSIFVPTAVALLIPIHRTAISGRSIFFSYQAIPWNVSLRLRLKMLIYLERLISENQQIGITIGQAVVTHRLFWESILLYIAYYLRIHLTFQSFLPGIKSDNFY